MNSTYEFTLKERAKVKIENFIETKNWRNFVEELKQKICIFIDNKNIKEMREYITGTNIKKRIGCGYTFSRMDKSNLEECPPTT